MDERTELLESAIENLPQAVALLNPEGLLVLWNRAAETITGYLAADLLGRAVPSNLEPLLLAGCQGEATTISSPSRSPRGTLVQFQHKAGPPLSAMTHTRALRNALGRQIGTALLFHSTDSMDVLPHGACAGDEGVRVSQAEVEEQLEAVFEDFQQGGPPFGILWIAVDQAPELRRTHGAAACASMMDKVERAISNGLRPGEGIGRWGDDELLVISHERTADLLESHARVLAGLAHTADFRWWGDRITLTVSIGAAHAVPGGPLAQLLNAARAAMGSSFQAG